MPQSSTLPSYPIIVILSDADLIVLPRQAAYAPGAGLVNLRRLAY